MGNRFNVIIIVIVPFESHCKLFFEVSDKCFLRCSSGFFDVFCMRVLRLVLRNDGEAVAMCNVFLESLRTWRA